MSTLVVTTLQDRVTGDNGPVRDAAKGSSRAWINFNGSTGAVRSSYNVTSITDNGTGDFTLNFTTAFSAGTYSFVGSAQNNANGTSGGERNVSISATDGLNASTARLIIKDGGGTSADSVSICVATFA